MSAGKRKADSYDPYAVLNLEPGCSNREIDVAYRKLALKWHPDKNPGNKSVAQKFLDIYKAYEFLKDDAKRNEFDEAAAVKKHRAAYETQRKATSTAKRQYFLDKLEEKERKSEPKRRPTSSTSRSSGDDVDAALLRRLRAEGAQLLRRMAEEAAAEVAKAKLTTRAANTVAAQANGTVNKDPYHMSLNQLADFEAEVLDQ